MPSKYDPKYYAANRERLIENQKRYYQRTRDERLAKQKAYNIDHREELKEARKKRAGRIAID